MPVIEKAWPVVSRGCKEGDNKCLAEFDWFFPLAELEAGELLISEAFKAFQDTWFMCVKARKNMRGGVCLRQSLHRCHVNWTPSSNSLVPDFKLVDVEEPQLERMKLRPVKTEIVEDKEYCNDLVEEPLSELRRRYAEKGIVCLRVTLASKHPEPCCWLSRLADDMEIELARSIDKPINIQHLKLESDARKLRRNMEAGNDEAQSSTDPCTNDELINMEPPKVESGALKFPQEKGAGRDEAKSSIEPKSDGEPINVEPPNLESGTRKFLQEMVSKSDEGKSSIDTSSDDEPPELESGAPTEVESSGDPNLDKGAREKNRLSITANILFLSLNCVALTALQHSTISSIWAFLDLIAFYVIYWGMYRKVIEEDSCRDEKANDYITCLALSITCTHTGVCYVSPFFFLAIYLLYTNRIERKIGINFLYELVKDMRECVGLARNVK